MFNGTLNAFKLELSSMKERKLSLLFYLFSPFIIIWINYYSANTLVNWGSYASLNLRLYDLIAQRLFPMILLFVTLQLTVLRIVGERAPAGTLDRDLMAISRSGMYTGKFIANAFFAALQGIIIYFAGYAIFPARNYSPPIYILGFLLLTAIFGAVTGLTVSVFSKTKEQAVQLAPIILLIFLLFSGNVVELNQMPQKIQTIAINSPLAISSESLRMLTLDGVGFEDVQMNVAKLLIWIFGIAIIGLIKFRYEKK